MRVFLFSAKTWVAIQLANSFVRCVHSTFSQPLRPNINLADEVKIAFKQDKNRFKVKLQSRNEEKIPKKERENEIKIPAVQGCTVYAEQSQAICFVNTLHDEALSPSLSLFVDSNMTAAAARKATEIRGSKTGHEGTIEAPMASLRASIAFCNHALKHLAAFAASSSEQVFDKNPRQNPRRLPRRYFLTHVKRIPPPLPGEGVCLVCSSVVFT